MTYSEVAIIIDRIMDEEDDWTKDSYEALGMALELVKEKALEESEEMRIKKAEDAGADELYDIFASLFPNLANDIARFDQVSKGSILLYRKETPNSRPIYIFSYRSERDWELLFI